MTHVNWSQALSRKFDRYLLSNKYVNLARVHGKTRASALRYLFGIGGYYNHGQCWALSWDVKMHGSMDFDDVYAVEAERRPEFTAMCNNDAERGLLYNYMKSVYEKHQNDWFNWATGDAWMQFRGDDNTFWGARRDSEFSLAGRSAGHLVMVQCGKINTAKSTPDLICELSERDPGDRGRYVVSHEDVVHLFLVAVQVSLDCTHKAVNDEILHRAAFDLWGRADESEFKDLQNVYRYMRAQTVKAALSGDGHCANEVRAMLGLPQEKPE